MLPQYVEPSLLEEPVDRLFGVQVTHPRAILRHEYLRKLRPFVSFAVHRSPPGVPDHNLRSVVVADEITYAEGDFTADEVISAIPKLDILFKKDFGDWVICKGIGFAYGIKDGMMIIPDSMDRDQEATVMRAITRYEETKDVDVVDTIRTVERRLISDYWWYIVAGPEIHILARPIESVLVGFGQSLRPANKAVKCTSVFQFETKAEPVADDVRDTVIDRNGLGQIHYEDPRVETDGNLLTLSERLPAETLN